MADAWLKSEGGRAHPAAEGQLVRAYRLHVAGTEPRDAHFAYSAVKRALDITGALLLLILLAPLLIVIAVAIKLDTAGPVFFRQQRAGERGKSFTCLKFRTMRVGAEAEIDSIRKLDVTLGPTFKTPVDPRVTRVGAVLRRYSLDELPQAFNVLFGRMSLVGPRPLIVSELENAPVRALGRLAVKPGLTCIWQVSGRSLITFEQWMDMDLEYVARRSLLLDLTLLLRTPVAVLSARGAF